MAYFQHVAIPVIRGGTGIKTATARGLVCAGTTSTGNFQVLTSLGTSGNVLESNGSSSLSSFSGSPVTTSMTGDSGTISGATITLTGSTNGASYACAGTTITKSINYMKLPTTTSTNGQIKINSVRSFHTFGTGNTFTGATSGNFTLTTASSLQNTGCGRTTLQGLSTGANNTALGSSALGHSSAVTASSNVIVGEVAGNTLASSSNNVVLAYSGMEAATAGQNSVSIGAQSLADYTSGTGNNIAIGFNSLGVLLTGTNNVCIGYDSGDSYTSSESNNICLGFLSTGTVSESNTLRIGNGTGMGSGKLNQAFISGIQSAMISGTAILVSSSDQLGVASSSERFKENIEDIGDKSSDILKLRPVTFIYKNDEEKEVKYGLIAEQAEQVYKPLVFYGKDGLPLTVKYHDLPALLLNELQKLVKKIDELETQLAL